MREFEQKHLSVHIEKTAGTSFESFLIAFYGKKNVYVYSNNKDNLLRVDNLVTLSRLNSTVDKLRTLAGGVGLTPLVHWLAVKVLRSEDKFTSSGIRLPRHWSVIHGHFNANKFDKLVNNPFRSVMFRDPLERTISHYKYWKNAKGIVNHRVSIPYSNEITFSDFAFLDTLQNFQTKALGGIPVEDFDAIGVTENLDSFISDIVKKRIGNDQSFITPHLNKTFGKVDYSELGIDEFFTKKFKSFNEDDYENYQKALILAKLPLDS